MNGEMILNSSIVLAAFLILFGLIYSIFSNNQLKKRREIMKKLHENLKVGSKVMFSAGLVGEIVELGDEIVKIRLADKLVIEASRFAITEIL
ncbi:MAG: preprotein translocase subunit YajC [Streptococcaceae bacterium]|jgi:preprotein translocase subunit YajC|nr:preprotein translocase subunit YajC [Streptococcaceae bacterium]